ncbi:uncharacterized protein LOC113216148 [Frankliniella occidentalis]|uniref:DNA-directed DNA polymerase n=1 Tax=Frankliniella occidentalis TaxID=133901 RepID=A0A6J1TDV1_FRAOC|nr:uncharacterized protein LOC113216148 [Frankliniella occidentalis]
MEGMFDTALQRQRDALHAKDDDRAIVEIRNGEHDANPIWFSMRRVDQLNGRVILDKVTRVLNSNQEFMADGQLRMSYIHVPTPRAGGRRTNIVANESMADWLVRKQDQKCVFSPDNVDNMCLTRSVAVAMAKLRVSRFAFRRMKSPASGIQTEKAESLCTHANIDKTQRCGIDEVRKLQDALPDFRLCVFTDKEGKECVFKGPYAVARKNIYLLWHAEHFAAIFYPESAFDYKFMCEKCVVFYNNAGDHRCPGSCWRCLGPDEHTDALRRCDSCGHQFAGDECFENHKTHKLPHSQFTKCDAFKFCNGCKRSYSRLRGGPHVCNFVYCKFCKNNVLENHLCFMQRWEEKEKNDKWSYHTVTYDIETSQCDPVEGQPDTLEHKPILLVSQTVCDACAHIQQDDYFCTHCKTRQHIFHCLDDPNINVMGQFLDYLQSFPAKSALLLVAHNAKAFDAIFALQEMIARKLKVDLTLQGAKIISMKVKTWKFIDSLMFLPMPLSSMPKAFGLNELKKGYWPYLACKPEYFHYEGPLLDQSYYCVSTMKSKAAVDFHTWYDQQVSDGYVFNFKKDLIDYCISDVTILRQSCHAFRKLFEQCAGFDPMFHCITLSSACMSAYRRNFLPPNKIGLVPDGGYHGRGKQSHAALRWLDFEAHKLGMVIKTVHTDREVSILGRRVDGYVEIPHPDGRIEKRVYQFHGCYWHHCPQHFPTSDDDKENRHERTQALTALFREQGYIVVEKWECKFNEELKTDPETIAFFEAHPTTRSPPLLLRDALVGGRTSAMRWYHKANLEKGERINMADVVSEYPNANLRGKYPYGHPKIYLEGDPDIPPVEEWNGMIKCTVLPPRDLFVPVLPYKARGRLMFPLCRTCVETGNKESCHHNDPSDRQLTSSWCAPELLLALQEKSYQLVTVHEVHQYPGTMVYNPDTGEDGLLSGYVRCFMALKMQASWWPPECDSEKKSLSL